jgi:hypothetical protein
MADARGDIQHHIGYAYHKLNDRRLMWIEYLEEKIAACRQRLRDSGKRAGAEPPATSQAQEEMPAPTTAEGEAEDESGEATEAAAGEESETEEGLW